MRSKIHQICIRAMQIPPLLQKYFEPLRNEILDTPLATEMRGVRGNVPPKNFEIIDAIGYVLMYYFDETIIYYKKYDYSYTSGYTLAMGYFATREIKKKYSLVDAFLLYFA